jgi:ABC-type lipoprotein release transport system permease subunit
VTAAWLWGRSELRARWRSWVILGLLAGATFGLAAAGFAGARRTSVAVPRFVAAVNAPTAAVLANDPTFDAAKRRAVARLPEVREVYPFALAFFIHVEPLGDDGGFIPMTPAGVRFSASPLVAGRLPDPTRADEVVVDQNLRRKFDLDLGATITISQSISREQAASIPPGMLARGVDPNFEQKLRVVGIAKSVDDELNYTPSSGFHARFGPRLAGLVNAFVTLRRGEADLARFQQDVQRIVGHPVNVESFAQLIGLPKITNIVRVERDGLLLFSLAVLIVGGVLVGQALARAVSAGAGELATWRAIGADRSIAVPALVLPATLTAAVGVASGVGVAVLMSRYFPISQARRFDLDLGVHADWFVLGLAAAAIVIAVLTTAIASALWTVAGRRSASRSPSAVGGMAARIGLPPALAIGSRLAVEPGRGRRAVPVRSALIGAVVGVLGVVGCFTFRAGLTDAATSPQRSGIVWDYVLGSGDGPVAPKELATIARDRDVESALHAVWFRAVRINGVTTPTFGTTALKGGLAPVVLGGRAPRTRDEIAFGPATLRDMKLHVGDRVPVGRSPGHTATVVGTALLPESSHTSYDQSAWMTQAGVQALIGPVQQLDPNLFEDYVLVKWRPDARIATAQRRLSALFEGGDTFTAPAALPTAVVSLGKLRSLPLALGVFFALLASATVAHALVTTVRRRRQELAVLRSIGFTRRQAGIAIAWQATLLAVVGLVVGVPLGIVAGRVIWRWLAHSFPVVYVPPIAILAVVVVIPVAIVVANLLAAGPARAAARIRPAEALRTE